MFDQYPEAVICKDGALDGFGGGAVGAEGGVAGGANFPAKKKKKEQIKLALYHDILACYTRQLSKQ